MAPFILPPCFVHFAFEPTARLRYYARHVAIIWCSPFHFTSCYWWYAIRPLRRCWWFSFGHVTALRHFFSRTPRRWCRFRHHADAFDAANIFCRAILITIIIIFLMIRWCFCCRRRHDIATLRLIFFFYVSMLRLCFSMTFATIFSLSFSSFSMLLPLPTYHDFISSAIIFAATPYAATFSWRQETLHCRVSMPRRRRYCLIPMPPMLMRYTPLFHMPATPYALFFRCRYAPRALLRHDAFMIQNRHYFHYFYYVADADYFYAPRACCRRFLPFRRFRYVIATYYYWRYYAFHYFDIILPSRRYILFIISHARFFAMFRLRHTAFISFRIFWSRLILLRHMLMLRCRWAHTLIDIILRCWCSPSYDYADITSHTIYSSPRW